MKINILQREVPDVWAGALTALERTLAARPNVTVRHVSSLLDTADADAWLVVAPTLATLLPELEAAAPERLARTLLVGPDLDFGGVFTAPPGSLPEALERYRLAGAFAAQALLAWQEVPSYFAGPKDQMTRHNTNALKAAQSREYAIWFAARGASLDEFLVAYVDGLGACG